MNKGQLQERCLEFAGFECYNAKLDIWLKPDGERTTPHLLDYPDFINSVDAHVKWTVPKLSYFYTEDCAGGWIVKLSVNMKDEFEVLNKSLALAICEAIWELTEKGND